MYENLKSKVNAYHNNRITTFTNDLDTITTGHALNHWYYRDRMTEAAYQAAKATPEDQPLPELCKKKMLVRFDRENEKDRARGTALNLESKSWLLPCPFLKS